MNDSTTDTAVVDAGVAPTEIQFDADGNPVLPAILDIRKGDAIEGVAVQSADEVGTNEVH
jgi:hypothetical protein